MNNDKIKQRAIIIGGLAISAVLVVLIFNQFKTPPVPEVETVPSSSSSQVADVVVPPISIPESVPPTTNGDDKGEEQTIQPDPVKPEPTEDELTDKTQTPDGDKVDLPETPEEEKEQEENPPAPPVDDTPQGGDKEDGKIYVPGFGWIEDIGEGEGTTVDGDGDIDKPVGIM